tara:strand:- start:185 stop:826 length:642 start_codon:yes stop_codon:yes gene_type:complete
MEAILKYTTNKDLLFVLFTISFFLIAILKSFYWKYLKLLFLGVFAQRYANQYLREENAFTERVNVLSFIIVIINFSIFVFKLNNYYTFYEFLKVCFILLIYFVIKASIIKLLGKIFMLKDLIQPAIFFTLLFDRVFGILILPILILMTFSAIYINHLLTPMIVVIFLFFLLLKIVSIWKTGTNSFGFSPIYLFLYLCTVEIIPVAIMIKVLIY